MQHIFRVQIAQLFAASLLVPLVSGCSYTMNQNHLIDSVVQSVPLADGKVLVVGYKLPDAVAQCQLIDESNRNWAAAQTLGQFKAGGGRQVLQEEAVKSVNQRPQDGINYAALIIPNGAGVGIINVTAGREAKTSYFRCTSPPSAG